LICSACGSRWYSAAADQMVGRDAPCPACGGGPLNLAEEESDETDEGRREASGL
jgi:hypothetical protein